MWLLLALLFLPRATLGDNHFHLPRPIYKSLLVELPAETMSSWLTLAARWYLATKRNRFYGHCWCWWRFFNVQFTLLTIGPFDNRLSTTMFLCSQNYTDNTINIRTINVYTDAHKYLTGPNNLQNIYIYMYNMIGCTIGGRRCHSLNALLIRFGKNKGNTRLVQRRVSGSDAQWLGVWRSGPPCANSQ